MRSDYNSWDKVLSVQVQDMRAHRSVMQSLTLSTTLLIMLLFLPVTGVSAQATLATLRGTVQDQSGAPLPGATVVTKNLETRLSRTVSSDAEGRFEVQRLLPGTYEVQASQAGFVSQLKEGLELGAEQLMTLDFMLETGSGPQEQSTQGIGSEAAESSSATTNRISESQLVGLPLNGRSYTQLATLEAGVSDTTAASSSRGIGGGGLTISGGRRTSNVFLLDGTNIMNLRNEAPRSAAGVQLGSDAVLQVQVFSTNYSAGYGRSSGGIMNSITRSGTPEFHATFFEYFRNSKLDARNFFDPGAEPPPFKRNQFGFVLTGPVRKDRTFFMASFEGLRDRLAETDVSTFLDADARNGIITDEHGEKIGEVTIHPKVAEYLKLFPIPNSTRLGGGVRENRTPRFLPTDEDFITVRLDHQISERDSLFGRYTFDDANSIGGGTTFLFQRQRNSRQQYLTLVETHIFSPSTLNSFRFGYTRPVDASANISLIEIPRELFFVPDAPDFGQLDIPRLSTFGPQSGGPQATTVNTFQFADDVVLQRGSHALKFGVQLHRYRWDTFSSSNKGGRWSFNSLESFLELREEETTNLTVVLPGSDNSQAWRQTLLGFYFQDAYNLKPNLQLDLGLRYEFSTLIHDKNGKSIFVADPFRDTGPQIGPYLDHNPSLRNLSPRVGISWTPGSSGNTQIRAGGGIYYDQLLPFVISSAKATAPFYKKTVRTNFDASDVFPDAVAAVEGVALQAQVMDYHNFTTSRIFRYNFQIQQQLPGGWPVQASYVGARGNHLFRKYEANLYPFPIIQDDGSLFFPPDAGPINPAFSGGLTIVSSDAQSFYNSFRLATNKSFNQGISLRASYTYSKSVDDGSRASNTDMWQYPYLRTLERGLSDFDIRHRLVFNYFYTLPFGSSQRYAQSGFLARVFGGWRMGGILRFRTGTPFTPGVRLRTAGFLFAPTKPNLLPGKSKNPVNGVTAGCGDAVPAGQELGSPDRYFDPCVYGVPDSGTLGNAGRNTIINPSVFNIDASLQKELSLGGDRSLQFRAEFFNLLNHTNFSGPRGSSSDVFTGSGRINRSVGRISRTATTARQIQFALRFSF